MPKIKAKSILEHRENQHFHLLEVAKQLLVTDGPKAVTPGSVAKLAGISRPAVYQYFENGTALIEYVVLDDFEDSLDLIDKAVAGATSPRDQAHAYVESVINQAAQGMHLSASALTGWPMPEDFKRKINALHRKQIEPFVAAMRELGVTEHVELALLGGIVETGVKLAETGIPAPKVIESVCDQIDAALARNRGANHNH